MSDFGFGPRYTTSDQREQKIIKDVNEALSRLNIRLSNYGTAVKATVNAVYKVGVGYGYEFTCVDYPGLKETLEKHPEFIRDDRSTLLGCFMAAKTKGTGYRQIGNSSSVHFQIDNNQCDVHVDSHGVVNQLGNYSLVGMLAHLPWDLLPYMTNYGYVRLGENVLLAPTIGLSPSMVTRLVSFYDNGLKGDLPTLQEFGSGVQFGYDLQIGAHTRLELWDQSIPAIQLKSSRLYPTNHLFGPGDSPYRFQRMISRPAANLIWEHISRLRVQHQGNLTQEAI